MRSRTILNISDGTAWLRAKKSPYEKVRILLYGGVWQVLHGRVSGFPIDVVNSVYLADSGHWPSELNHTVHHAHTVLHAKEPAPEHEIYGHIYK
jgi:hypothetical protein